MGGRPGEVGGAWKPADGWLARLPFPPAPQLGGGVLDNTILRPEAIG